MTEIPEPIRQQCESRGGLEAIMASLPPDTVVNERSHVLKALGEPMRLKILLALAEQPLCACLLREMLGISDSRLSYHLGVLRDAGLIVGDRMGSWIIYRATEMGGKLREAILEHME